MDTTLFHPISGEFLDPFFWGAVHYSMTYGLHNEWMDVGKQQIAYFLTFHPKRVNSIFGSIIIMQWFLIWTSAQCRI